MTELIMLCGIAVGLAMDALAVSIVSGSIFRELRLVHGLRMALFFGAFQALMPLLGWAAGRNFTAWFEDFDHWIAFGLLTFIGGKMIVEALRIRQVERKPPDPSKLAVLLMLSIATSIDALVVGLTLSLITCHIITAVVLIGLLTFLISWFGWELGRRIGHFFEIKIEALGGLILIAIGFKILLRHLFFC
jgi:putative Mn2+ efflux pump MntP